MLHGLAQAHRMMYSHCCDRMIHLGNLVLSFFGSMTVERHMRTLLSGSSLQKARSGVVSHSGRSGHMYLVKFRLICDHPIASSLLENSHEPRRVTHSQAHSARAIPSDIPSDIEISLTPSTHTHTIIHKKGSDSDSLVLVLLTLGRQCMHK